MKEAVVLCSLRTNGPLGVCILRSKCKSVVSNQQGLLAFCPAFSFDEEEEGGKN